MGMNAYGTTMMLASAGRQSCEAEFTDELCNNP